MPHTFNPHPKHPAVDYLIRLHADIGGRILANKKQAETLAEQAKAVEAVIKMFDPDFNVRKIAPRRRNTGNQWFKRGTLFRAVLDTLRGATGPMTVREIALAVLASKGAGEPDMKAVKSLEGGIRASLDNHNGKTVERVGEGVPARWLLTN